MHKTYRCRRSCQSSAHTPRRWPRPIRSALRDSPLSYSVYCVNILPLALTDTWIFPIEVAGADDCTGVLAGDAMGWPEVPWDIARCAG
jgi:hypothetical protein